MQAMGNTYYAYTHLSDFKSWSELFGLIDEDIIYQKRLLSIISGAILPLVSLGFIKSLVDYIKPSEKDETPIESNGLNEEKDNPEITESQLDESEVIEVVENAISGEAEKNSILLASLEGESDFNGVDTSVHIDPMRIK